MSDNRTCVKCGRGTAKIKSWTVGQVPVGQDLCGECAGHYGAAPKPGTNVPNEGADG